MKFFLAKSRDLQKKLLYTYGTISKLIVLLYSVREGGIYAENKKI